ncbi:MAG: AEC family transporter [Thiothrix sp.]|nr:AEC family transporter [Thiothrix sp.]
MSIVPESNWRGIEALGYWLLFPALVMVSLIRMDLAQLNLTAISKAYLGALLVHIVLILLLGQVLCRHFGMSRRSFSSVFQTSVRWNGFIALAIATRLAGEQGVALVALIMALTIPLLNFVTIGVLTVYTSDSPPTLKTAAINTLKVPLIWGALLGIAINLWQIPVYEPFMAALDIVGQGGLGISLLAVGAGVRVQAMLQARGTVLIGVMTKLLVFPALVALGCWLTGVTGLTLQIALLCASVSTAMNGYILAKQMGGDADLYAATATVQVLVSIFTLPLILWLAGS